MAAAGGPSLRFQRLSAALPREVARPTHSVRPARWRALLARDHLATAAIVGLSLLAIAAILAPALAPYDPARIDLAIGPTAPGLAHPLGTDTMGRDLLSRLLFGARTSLAVGVGAATIAALLGLTLGLVAANGGLVDAAICRLVDAAMAIPAFFLLIALQSILGSSVIQVILLVSMTGWMAVARVVRALAMSMKGREYVLAARALGCSTLRILVRHLLPNLAGQVVVLFALGVADALLMESALSFIGLGVPPTQPSWGSILNDAQAAILSGAWWVALFPGLMILATALAINLAGDGLRRILDAGAP